MNQNTTIDYTHGAPVFQSGEIDSDETKRPVKIAPLVELRYPDVKRQGIRFAPRKPFAPADSQEKQLDTFVNITFPRMLELRTVNEHHDTTSPASEFKYVSEPEKPVFQQAAQYRPGIVSAEVYERNKVQELPYKQSERYYCTGKGPLECPYCAARQARQGPSDSEGVMKP